MSQNKRMGQKSRKRTEQNGTGNLPDPEFKTLVIKILNELRGIVDELVGHLTKK